VGAFELLAVNRPILDQKENQSSLAS
jgi:hypothetical protein